MSSSRLPFQFRPALKLGAWALLIALAVGLGLLLMAPPTADMTLLGQGVGQFAGLSFVGGLLTSYQEQTGNPKMALLMKVIWGILLVGMLVFGLSYQPPTT